MCKLLLSFRQVFFCPVSILSVDYGYTILTNWFGPYGKYLDLSSSDGPHFVRSDFKTAVQIFCRMDFTFGQ